MTAAPGFRRSLWAEAIACPSANRQTPEGRGPRGEGYERQKFRSTRYRSRSRVVEIPCDYAWDCGSSFPFCSLFLVPAVPLWCPLPRVQGPRAERLGRSPAVVALFPYGVVVLGFSSMSGLMLESRHAEEEGTHKSFPRNKTTQKQKIDGTYSAELQAQMELPGLGQAAAPHTSGG